MASPVILHILPVIGFDALDVLDEQENSDESSEPAPPTPTASGLSGSASCSHKYRIPKTILKNLLLINDGTEHPSTALESTMSPFSPVSLPSAIRGQACVPEKTRFFAYLHPPISLKERIDWDMLRRVANSEQFETDPRPTTPPVMNDSDAHTFEYYDKLKPLAFAAYSLFGGFAYFDANYNVLRINAITSMKTKFQIRACGPFRVNQDVALALQLANRAMKVSFPLLHESGVNAMAWVCANEVFRSNETLLEQKNIQNSYGCFVYFRDDGEADAFLIQNETVSYSDGDIYWVADFLQHGPRDGIPSKHQVAMGMRYLKLDADETRRRLQDAYGRQSLNDIVDFGWTPLHYACRYTPGDTQLIKLIMNEYPNSTKADCYGRYPLHLALDQKAPDDVIFTLLKGSSGRGLQQKTTFGQFLPLHFAAYRGASESVIKALLDADKNGTTVLAKNAYQSLPLHLAIATKSKPSVIKMLLEANTESCRNVEDYDIYQGSMDLLPLHMAVWNNSSVETVKLLLEKDTLDVTIDTEVDARLSNGIGKLNRSFVKPKFQPSSTIVVRKTSFKKSLDNVKNLRGMLAIHIAMMSGSSDVINLLLQRERQRVRRRGENMTIQRQDYLGRTPLHIACAQNLSMEIIQFIINLDPHGQLTHVTDLNRRRPLHKACQIRGGNNLETVQALLEAEERYLLHLKATKEYSVNRHKHSTKTFDDRNRSPLHLAIKYNTSVEVFKLFLSPELFNLETLDRNAIRTLARYVNENEDLQGFVIDRISLRILFFALSMELYTICLALYTFFWATDRLEDDLETFPQRMTLYYCGCLFLIREVIKIKSQSFHYIFDIFNWVDLLSIVFIILSATRMILKKEMSEFSNILILTSFFLIISLVAFLRSAFLPFARSVGGLAEMIIRLIPFFIVSALSLLAFAYSYRVQEEEECNSLAACYEFVLQGFFFGLSDVTDNALDVLFGIFMVAILLNVVIAIVNEVWATATERATLLFWQYRLAKISELRSFFNMVMRWCNKIEKKAPWVSRFLDYIDNIRFPSFSDDVTWLREPYNQVKRYEQYIAPENWFAPEAANIIEEAQSLQAELYWAKVEHNRKKKMKNASSKRGGFDDEPLSSIDAPSSMEIIGKWVARMIFYCMVILFGFASAGILQPRRVRQWLLGKRGHTGTKEDKEIENIPDKKND